jgi:enoyl-CoA hydratase
MPELDLAIADGVATVTLNAPDRRNALTLGLGDELVAALDAAEADQSVGAIVVTGAPPSTWRWPAT